MPHVVARATDAVIGIMNSKRRGNESDRLESIGIKLEVEDLRDKVQEEKMGCSAGRR